jgi:hypothetical protein
LGKGPLDEVADEHQLGTFGAWGVLQLGSPGALPDPMGEVPLGIYFLGTTPRGGGLRSLQVFRFRSCLGFGCRGSGFGWGEAYAACMAAETD